VVAAAVAAFSIVIGIGELTRKREYQSLLVTWGLPADLYDHLGQLEELTLPGTVTRLDWLSSAKRLKKLTIRDGVLKSLEGLPEGLETLNVGESRLSDLKGIPPSLISLTLGASRIEIVEGLPGTLRSLGLDLSDNATLTLETLPRSLVSLSLVMPVRAEAWEPDFRELGKLQSLTLDGRGKKFALWDRLPIRLRSLSLDQYHLTSFHSVPRNLKSLSFRGSSIPSLSELPPGIEMLDLDYLYWPAGTSGPEIDVPHLRTLRSLTIQLPSRSVGIGVRLRRLPQGLETLKVNSEWVVLSGDLPRSLKELEFPGAVIGAGEDEILISRTRNSLHAANRIPDLVLPSGLESLALARLPQKLPVGLKRLKTPNPRGVLPAGLRNLDLDQDFRNESFSRLPDLPEGLTELNLRGTWVRELPGNLQRLTHLVISSTPIDTIDRLPPRLKSLTLSVRQVETLEGLPESVTALHFQAEWPYM